MTAREPETFTGFGPDLLEFYEGLAADSSTAYWQAHRSVYDEQVGGPARALAAALQEEFGPVKVFRPHRDVRFSGDKTPYRTNVSILAGRGGAGAWCFSASPEGVDLAGGVFAPSKDQLYRFRRLQDDGRRAGEMDALFAGLDGRGFSTMQQGALRTAPRGWSRGHPRIEVLRLRHLAVGQQREPGPWLGSAAALEVVTTAWRALTGWNAWLDQRVGVPLQAAGPSGTDAPR